jgi:hypothetical protein
MQVTAGTLAETPCKSCSRGTGPFESCVVSEFSPLGSCANCYYGGRRWECSFRNDKEAAEPAQPAQPVAGPAQFDDPFLLPREIPEGLPYLEKRATARWLRDMADEYDRSAENDVHHEYV